MKKIRRSDEEVAKLKKALEDAIEQANQVSVPDSGTANMDQAVINLGDWPVDQIRSLPFVGRKIESRWWRGYREIVTPCNGQGWANTKTQETVRDVIKAAGFDCVSVMYIVD